MPSSRAATFTDEIIETHVAPDGTLEASLVGGSAEEVKDAVADFVRCEKDFREVNSRPHAATEPSRHPGME
jgi:hypothetical protein